MNPNPTPQPKRLAVLQLVLVTVVAGGTLPLTALTGQHLNPIMALAARFVIAAAPLLGFLHRATRGAIRDGLGLGVIGFLIYFAQAMALQTLSINRVAVLISLNLVLVPIILIVMGRNVSAQHVLVSVFGLVGVLVMKSDVSLSTWSAGDAWGLLGAFARAGRSVRLEQVAARHEGWVLTAVQSLTIAVISGLLAVPYLEQLGGLINVSDVRIADLKAVSGLLYLGLAATLFTSFLTIRAHRLIAPCHASAILSLELVTTACFAWGWLGQVPSANEVLGAVIVMLAGVLMDVELWSRARPVSGVPELGPVQPGPASDRTADQEIALNARDLRTNR
jgi:drug/metabolite transporter (DMT)-like permease